MNDKGKIFVLIGAGFSKPAGLPLAMEINKYFTRDNVGKILKFGSGETKWYDFANDTDRHNGRLGFDYLGYEHILNALVDIYIHHHYSFINYEDFYQFAIDNLKQNEFISLILKKAQESCIEKFPDIRNDINGDNYLYRFKYTSQNQIIDLINHLIADLLYWRKEDEEIYNEYNAFTSFLNPYDCIDITTLNHDLLIEFLLKERLRRDYADGFSINQNILFSPQKNPLNIFTGDFSKKISLIKLHGSIDTYKYLIGNEVGVNVTLTGEYIYFKTQDFNQKHSPERYDPNTGNLIQSFHFQIMPQFITGTKKDVIIQNDKMYACLYSEFGKRIHLHEQMLIVGYSYRDSHVNDKIQMILSNKTVKQIINVNPKMEFPFQNEGVQVFNLKEIKELNNI